MNKNLKMIILTVLVFIGLGGSMQVKATEYTYEMITESVNGILMKELHKDEIDTKSKVKSIEIDDETVKITYSNDETYTLVTEKLSEDTIDELTTLQTRLVIRDEEKGRAKDKVETMVRSAIVLGVLLFGTTFVAFIVKGKKADEANK